MCVIFLNDKNCMRYSENSRFLNKEAIRKQSRICNEVFFGGSLDLPNVKNVKNKTQYIKLNHFCVI